MFYITISNGLLHDGHPKRMGSAVWAFMWCIDKVTRIDATGFGWVLGGKPIKLEEVAEDLQLERSTISEHLTKLEELGYIKKIIAPYGISIRVNKAKKRFTKAVKGSEIQKPRSGNPEPRSRKPKPNKTVSVDSTDDTSTATSAEEVFDFKKYIEEMESSGKRNIEIIGYYFKRKRLSFDTKPQAQSAIRRYLRAAKDLVPFDDDRLIKATETAIREYPDKWTLETVYKLITK